ncbi:uncharacterized protein EV420DRAFT_227807 [Desarmillaria tabescens]|uniref:Uncharacterized protein n=1 Tax=Armillaria tabescens TaxID=1929756 RepID=A0AA39T2X6_ARMTA|nr:uncharacterized protein EV420DRAFT_227807 [Desarmillaria tabescens]KAK0460721.1 hypothetical protein EV420DRAFT_227807 [Desarmillaria tabescens]
MSNTDTPSSVFFKEEYEGEIRAMTLSACISALVAARETDRVNVIRLEHIKYTNNWLHEAILVELQEVDPDAAAPRKAYALIDRDAERNPPRKTYFSSSPSFSGKARDGVKLSRDKGSFTTNSDRYEVRRYIDFATHPFPFVQLLVAASTVAETKPKYNLITSQCYWYAESIWDVVILHLQQVWSDGWEKAANGSLAVPARGLAREMFAKFEGAWTKLEAEIKKRRQDQRQKENRAAFMQGVLTGRKEAEQEKEALQHQNTALEAQLKILEAKLGNS